MARGAADAAQALAVAGWVPERGTIAAMETVQAAMTVAPTPKPVDWVAPCAGMDPAQTKTAGMATMTIRMVKPT